ncbi:MAG: radical SAM protein [Candidatus Omnitrophica bacterium]|nr:radical SAM protein [Candidatus Omnitrophota bacterium]
MDCRPLVKIPYSKFSQKIHSKVKKDRTPICGTIELTFRCNMGCVHCYCLHDIKEKELSFKEISRLLDEIAASGCLWLLITGGEPLLRKDFLDIYGYAKNKGMIITLFTNATLVTDYIADYLREYPPFRIEVSIYGASKETHEKITGVPGSFKECLKGIDILRERKLPLSLKTMVMNLNFDEVRSMEKFAQDLGLSFRLDTGINPRLDGCKEPCKFRVLPSQVVELDFASYKRAQELRQFCEQFWGGTGSDNLYICGAGVNSFNIDPYGYLTVCEMSRAQSFSLLKNSFKEVWYDRVPEVLSRKCSSDYRCNSCELISLCGQCPGWGQLENSDPQKPVEYLCKVAHLRAEALGLIKPAVY